MSTILTVILRFSFDVRELETDDWAHYIWATLMDITKRLKLKINDKKIQVESKKAEMLGLAHVA
jgi:hypothetical protein